MADLGILNTTIDNDNNLSYLISPLSELAFNQVEDNSVSRIIPRWLGGDILNQDISGVLHANVSVDGNPEKNSLVRLFHRTSVEIDAGKTDENGYLKFSNLKRGDPDYFAIALTEKDYNALIYDKLIPE